MNREFHYDVTHLIAARVGGRSDDLRMLTYASQYVDDTRHKNSVVTKGWREMFIH